MDCCCAATSSADTVPDDMVNKGTPSLFKTYSKQHFLNNFKWI